MPPKRTPELPKPIKIKDRRHLTLGEKIEVFTYFREVKCSARKLAKIFNIGKTQAGDIIKKGDTLLHLFQYDSCYNSNCKLRPGSVGFEIDRIVFAWYSQMKNENNPVSGPMIQNKALDFAKEMGCSKFKASNGWLLRFLRRHKIVLSKSQNETGDGESNDDELFEELVKCEIPDESDETVKVRPSGKLDFGVDDSFLLVSQEWEKIMAVLLPKYSAEDIFSVVQTGLFYKAVPSDTPRLEGETCSCGKFATERCTILFCVSMSGAKEKPLVIANISKSEIKKINKSDVDCTISDKSWLTKSIMTKWLREMDKKIGKEKRNIVLFLNHSTPRPDCQFKNIQIANYPSLFSPENHPLDQIVIQNFKIIYRQQLLKHLIQLKESDENDTLPDEAISTSQATEWISTAWKELSESVIYKGFEDLGFNPFVTNANNSSNETSASLDDVSNLLCAFDSDANAADYVSLDNNLETWDNTENVEVLVDHDSLKQMFVDNEEEMGAEPTADTRHFEPQQTFPIRSYSDALQSLKDLEHFYLSQNNANLTYLVHQLITYNQEYIGGVEIKMENQNV